MEASMWVILSTNVACQVENEAVVAENVRTVSWLLGIMLSNGADGMTNAG